MSHVVTCRGGVCALVVIPLVLASCGGPNNPQPTNTKKTIPVRGEVFVDGQPGNGVKVHLIPKGGGDTGNPTTSVGDAGEDGKFQIRTYGGSDGAPAGEYTLTFERFEPGIHIRLGGKASPDLFGAKYADPKTSKHSVTVPEDATEVEIPRIELSSK